jgi:hypothetical protein
MRYTMDRSGIGRMMRSDPGIHRVLHSSAKNVLAIARSRATVKTGFNRESGRVEDAGIQRVFRGEPRMTVRVVFHSRYAMDQQARTGFLSGAIAQGRPTRRGGR